jgi:hypothetical protein
MSRKKRKKMPAAQPSRSTATPQAAAPKKSRGKFWAGLIAFVGAAAGVKEFVYPVIVDYMDGKFGSSLELTINNAPLNQGIPTYVLFPAGDAKNTDRFAIPVGLALMNDAQVKAGEVTLSARFDKNAHRAALDQFVTYAGSRLTSDVKHETNSDSRHDYAIHRVNFLAPHEGMNFSEGGISLPIPFSLAPYEPVLFSAHQGLDLQITALSDRDDEQTWDVRYRAITVHNMDQMSHYIKTYYAKQVALDLRQQLGTWEYLWRIAFGSKAVIVGYEPKFTYFPAVSLYAPPEMPKDHLVYRFDPYKLSLLFDKPAE